MRDRYPGSMVIAYFIFLFLLATLLLGRLLWPFLSILVLSYLLTTIFEPIYRYFSRKLSPGLSSLLTCLLIAVIIFIPLTFFVAALSSEAFALFQFTRETNLALKVREFIEGSTILARIETFLAGFGIQFQFEFDQFSRLLSDFVTFSGRFIYNQASSWAANILNSVFNFLMMILIIFFLLIDRKKMLDYFVRISPLPDEQDLQLIDKFEKISKAILVGNGVCGLIQGVLGSLAFIFFNLGSPILWGGVMGILAFLPIFGIGLVLLPAALILFIQGNVVGGVIMVIFYILLSFSIEYLLKPKMVGEQVKMPTLLVFLSILGGLSVFGFLGIIYGPLIAVGFLTLAEIYVENYEGLIKQREAPVLEKRSSDKVGRNVSEE